MAGIFATFNSITEPVEYSFLNLPVEFSQLFFDYVADFNRPSQVLLSTA